MGTLPTRLSDSWTRACISHCHASISMWINQPIYLHTCTWDKQAHDYNNVFLSTMSSCLWLEQSWSVMILHIASNHYNPQFCMDENFMNYSVLWKYWKWPSSCIYREQLSLAVNFSIYCTNSTQCVNMGAMSQNNYNTTGMSGSAAV